ncbi:MAG TPA: hypothetical protein VKH35_00425 [Thermoanaerobaculia bacterium]|jgi:hypothetical protein|nr:hypothetical protein [Thermoanaerobaculia bacterium]
MPYLAVLLVATAAVLVALALAYLPMRVLVGHIARHVNAFIQRQRERRAVARGTPDRRKAG